MCNIPVHLFCASALVKEKCKSMTNSPCPAREGNAGPSLRIEVQSTSHSAQHEFFHLAQRRKQSFVRSF